MAKGIGHSAIYMREHNFMGGAVPIFQAMFLPQTACAHVPRHCISYTRSDPVATTQRGAIVFRSCLRRHEVRLYPMCACLQPSFPIYSIVLYTQWENEVTALAFRFCRSLEDVEPFFLFFFTAIGIWVIYPMSASQVKSRSYFLRHP